MHGDQRLYPARLATTPPPICLLFFHDPIDHAPPGTCSTGLPRKSLIQLEDLIGPPEEPRPGDSGEQALGPRNNQLRHAPTQRPYRTPGAHDHNTGPPTTSPAPHLP